MIKRFNQYIKESNEPKDIDIKVEGKNSLIDQLIDNLSLVVRKRKIKSLHIKSITGYINKEFFTGKGYLYETQLSVTLNNKNILFGEYKSKSNEILIKVNDEIIYHLNHKTFDNEVLIDKMVNEYIKYLKNNKFKINESNYNEQILNLNDFLYDFPLERENHCSAGSSTTNSMYDSWPVIWFGKRHVE